MFRIILSGIFLIILNFGLEAKELSSLGSQQHVYRVGLPNVPGLMYRDSIGKVCGFPLELTEHLLNEENVKFEWVDGKWNELFTKLIEGEIDILPGTQRTKERQQYLDYLDESLFTIWSELYVHSDCKFKNIVDLRDKKIGLVEGDNNGKGFLKYYDDFHIPSAFIYFGSHNEAVQGLKDKQVFAYAGPSINSFVGSNSFAKSTHVFFNPSDLNISFTKGKHLELINRLDKRVKLYKENPNSVYHQLHQEYKLARFQEVPNNIPEWVKYSVAFILLLLIVSLLFVYVLKKQIQVKTKHLKERELFLREAMLIGEMGIWSIDLDTNNLYWSEEQNKLHGYDADFKIDPELMAKQIHPEDREMAIQVLQESIAQRKDFVVDFKVFHKSGEIIHTRQKCVIQNDENGKPIKALGITKNINKEFENQEMMLEALNRAEESDRLKTAFLANMSHEIRTPMNGIVGFASLLNNKKISEDKKTEYIKIINESGNQLLGIINDIIDISKIETGRIETHLSTFDVHAYLEKSFTFFEPLFAQKNVELNLHKGLKAENFSISSDPTKFQQIITNLLSNARKFTRKGQVDFGYHLRGEMLEFYVKDTGIGIPQKDQESVFKRFRQSHNSAIKLNEGTGLGLAITKAYVELLGGAIHLKSAEGKGSEFSFTLPINKTFDSKTSTMHRPYIDFDKEVNVLVAEDNEINYLFLQECMKVFPNTIYWAKNGLEAVEEVKQNKIYDLILMDIKMPIMDGYQAIRKIREINPDIPIIAQTAYGMENDEDKAIEAGANAYLTKPLDKNVLLEHITRLLRKKFANA